MASTPRSIEAIRETVSFVRGTAVPSEKMVRYDIWAENYEQDLAFLNYSAPSMASDIISSNFTGDRQAAVVLDVACGTGLVAKKMKEIGFENFVGIDGSKLMLEEARKKGLYKELKLCLLVQELLPVPSGFYDLVVICGALTVDHVAVSVLRELCSACKTGGLVCMTCRGGDDNVEYKAQLEREQKRMEEEGLWIRVAVADVDNYAKLVKGFCDSYVPGSVYLYRKL